jgi:small subunit ribosomal protein S6
MNTYELLYIIGAQFTDDEIDTVRENVKKVIEKVGGKISRDENLGKIKLAYPIKKMRHGTYILLHVEVESEAVKSLDKEFRLHDDVLRHQIVALPESEKKRKYKIDSYVAPLSEEAHEKKRETRTPSKPVVPTKTIAPPAPAKIEETSPSMSMEELDKKLDSILEEDVTKKA